MKAVQRDGAAVTITTARRVYRARIGVTYAPDPRHRDQNPKRLVDVTQVGAGWVAALEPVEGGGRARLVDVFSFATRYRVPFDRQETQEDDAAPRTRTLARVERKLDAILSALGVEVKEPEA